MALEIPNMRAMWLAVAKFGAAIKQPTVLFRVNTGKGWVPTSGKPYRTDRGDVVVPGGRPVALGFGLANGDPAVGTSDLVGGTSIVITPEMVGCRVEVLTLLECKRTSGGRRSREQVDFISARKEAGAIAGFVANEDEAVNLIKNYRPPRP